MYFDYGIIRSDVTTGGREGEREGERGGGRKTDKQTVRQNPVLNSWKSAGLGLTGGTHSQTRHTTDNYFRVAVSKVVPFENLTAITSAALF